MSEAASGERAGWQEAEGKTGGAGQEGGTGPYTAAPVLLTAAADFRCLSAPASAPVPFPERIGRVILRHDKVYDKSPFSDNAIKDTEIDRQTDR